MIKSITVTNYVGDSITIKLREPETTGFLISSITGLGPAKAEINTTDISAMDGSMFNSARMSQRNIVLGIVFTNTYEKESIEDLRLKSYKYFPLKKKLELLIETDNRLVKTMGYVESNEPNIFSSMENTQISIICPDPYFYDAGANQETEFYSVEPLFEFPFSNESLTKNLIEFSRMKNAAEGNIHYLGDADIGMTIYIHAIGPATNVYIHNLGTLESMKIDTTKLKTLTGSGIIERDEIIITTVKGEKNIVLVREGKIINILNCLDRNVCWLGLTKGDNVFAFTADSGILNLQFRIENRIIYEGV